MLIFSASSLLVDFSVQVDPVVAVLKDSFSTLVSTTVGFVSRSVRMLEDIMMV